MEQRLWDLQKTDFIFRNARSQSLTNKLYMVIRNVPALGCGDDLMSLFTTYGEVEDKPMDAEDCEEFTDVFCLKFRLISNARFAKRKLDESVFLGNRLQVSYAPEFESLTDTKDMLETRRKEVLSRNQPSLQRNAESRITRVSSDQEYLASSSMNQTVKTVRENLDKIQESDNQKRIIQPSSQKLPNRTGLEENPSQ